MLVDAEYRSVRTEASPNSGGVFLDRPGLRRAAGLQGSRERKLGEHV